MLHLNIDKSEQKAIMAAAHIPGVAIAFIDDQNIYTDHAGFTDASGVSVDPKTTMLVLHHLAKLFCLFNTTVG